MKPMPPLASRRVALRIGGALAAVVAGDALIQQGVSAQATPATGAARPRPLLIQSFSRGSLFPTQGEAGVLPYTIILWDAVAQGIVVADPERRAVGIVTTKQVLDALTGAAEPPLAVLAAPGQETIWAMRLVSGSLGSDPGAVTYQAELPDSAEATALLGTTPAVLPDGPEDVAGYLLVVGLAGLDAAGSTFIVWP